MLQSIRILSFRNCKGVSLSNLKDPIVLLGRNGAGKTSILLALTWIANFARESDLYPHLSYPDDAHVELRIRTKHATLMYSVKKSVHVEHNTNNVSKSILETLKTVGTSKTPSQTIFTRTDTAIKFGEDERPLSVPIGDNSSALNIIANYVDFALTKPDEATQVNDSWLAARDAFYCITGLTYYPLQREKNQKTPTVFRGTGYDEWKKTRVSDLDKDEDLSYTLIDAHLTKPEKFQEIKDLLGPNGLDVIEQIETFDIKVTPQSSKPEDRLLGILIRPIGWSAEEGPGVGLSALSMGTRRILQFITHLVLDRTSVALIEQPEDAIHPALLRKLMGVIFRYASERQFIMTSHSPEVFNLLNVNQVRIVGLENGKTFAKPLTSKEQQHAIDYMNDCGTLADFLESL